MIEIKFTFAAPTCAKIDDECECVLCTAALEIEDWDVWEENYQYVSRFSVDHTTDDIKDYLLLEQVAENELWVQEQVEAQLAEQEADRIEELTLMAQMRGYA